MSRESGGNVEEVHVHALSGGSSINGDHSVSYHTPRKKKVSYNDDGCGGIGSQDDNVIVMNEVYDQLQSKIARLKFYILLLTLLLSLIIIAIFFVFFVIKIYDNTCSEICGQFDYENIRKMFQHQQQRYVKTNYVIP